MSDTPGACELLVDEAIRGVHLDHDARQKARAHDAEDAWRFEVFDKQGLDLHRVIKENVELRDLLRLLEAAWTDSDVHPRHAPGTCESCDRVTAAVDAQEVRCTCDDRIEGEARSCRVHPKAVLS